MIQPEKYSKALRALQQIIVRARFLAAKENQMPKVVGLLDAAEELPQLIADTEDRTAEFAAALQAIAERYPYCRNIFTDFVSELPKVFGRKTVSKRMAAREWQRWGKAHIPVPAFPCLRFFPKTFGNSLT